MKKILFINSSWNLYKTKSSIFLAEFLSKRGYEVEIMPFFEYPNKELNVIRKLNFMSKKVTDIKENMKKGRELIQNSKNYHAIIFFQNICGMNFISRLKCKNIIFVPMYDWYATFSYNTFFEMLQNGIKFLNFSQALQHRTLGAIEILKYNIECATKYDIENGGGGGNIAPCKIESKMQDSKNTKYNSLKTPLYVQYFLKPSDKTTQENNLHKVFFWQRREEINFLALKTIFKYYSVGIHIHVVPDGKITLHSPNADDIKKYNITFSQWLENKNDLDSLLRPCGIYIAPRINEGIGLGLLQALSLGKVIIAHNAPTMSEYITHNVNGYLLDFENPKPLDFSNILEVQKNAKILAKSGYEKWLKNREKIVEFIES